MCPQESQGNISYLFGIWLSVAFPEGIPRRFIPATARVFEEGKLHFLISWLAEEVAEPLNQAFLRAQRHAVALDLEEAIAGAGISDFGDDTLLVLWGFGVDVAAEVDDG